MQNMCHHKLEMKLVNIQLYGIHVHLCRGHYIRMAIIGDNTEKHYNDITFSKIISISVVKVLRTEREEIRHIHSITKIA